MDEQEPTRPLSAGGWTDDTVVRLAGRSRPRLLRLNADDTYEDFDAEALAVLGGRLNEAIEIAEMIPQSGRGCRPNPGVVAQCEALLEALWAIAEQLGVEVWE